MSSAKGSSLTDGNTLARRIRFVRTYGAWRRAVRELWRFKWRENRRRRMVGAYHTRSRGIPYFIRHTTRDVGIFAEIFISGEYEPPDRAAQRLEALGRPPRILDLGGNVGLFAAFCLDRWPGAHVVSVEPDPHNLELLRRTAAGSPSLEVISGCATSHDGTVRFAAGMFADSYVVTEDTDDATIQLPSVDAFPLAETADFIKMDIEGSEWEILADPRMASLKACVLVMEWHQRDCPYPNPSAAVRKALHAAGFEVISERVPIPVNGTVWAVRPE